MPPKKRLTENKGLPQRWRLKHGAYYYRVPPGLESAWEGKTEYRLGKTLAEAHQVYAERIQNPDPVYRIDSLLDKYQALVVSQQKPNTRRSKENIYHLLRPVLGEMAPDELQPTDVYQVLDAITAKYSQSIARIAYSYLSHVYTKAIEWGIVENHPIKGKVKKPSPNKRTRYVKDWELQAALSVASPTIKAHIFIKLVTGMRKSDILSLKMLDIFKSPHHLKRLQRHPEQITIDDLNEGGLPVTPIKTRDSSGKRNLIAWEPQVVSAVQYALSINPCMDAEYLLLNSRCKCYRDENGQASGFDSLWQRWQEKAINKTSLTERFQEKDIRAKVASDTDLQHASKLLAHTTEQITEQSYRRKGEIVQPANVEKAILQCFQGAENV